MVCRRSIACWLSPITPISGDKVAWESGNPRCCGARANARGIGVTAQGLPSGLLAFRTTQAGRETGARSTPLPGCERKPCGWRFRCICEQIVARFPRQHGAASERGRNGFLTALMRRGRCGFASVKLFVLVFQRVMQMG